MAKTNSDFIRELQIEIGTAITRIEILDREQRTESSRATEADHRLTEVISQVREKVAVLDQIVSELKRTTEENDRRRWSLSLLFVGSLLTLVANLALFAMRGNSPPSTP